MTPIELILGPQLPIGDSYFDKTQLQMAKMLGEACPVTPPTDPAALNDYQLHLQYYDLPKSLYIVHARTQDVVFLEYARKAADSWWKHPTWIDEGRFRPWPDNATPPPRHVGIGGLILRALDGRPELWDYCVAYTREFLNIYFLWRLKSEKLHVDIREGAFVFHYATWLIKALPDSYPLQSGGMATNGAQVRAQLHADLVKIVKEYYQRLQYPCGCWRYDVDMKDTDGGTLVQVTQPFTLGLLLLAFADFAEITTDTPTRDYLKSTILKVARHLYLDGPYRKNDPVPYDPRLRWRAFWYLFHGGTTVNPTKFEKGGWSYAGTEMDHVRDARQSIGPVIGTYGKAYQLSGDPLYLEALRELWDSAYGETDGIKTYFNTDGKGFNQHCARAGSGPAWAGLKDTALLPAPAPIPQPPPEPEKPPMPIPSPDNTKAVTITDKDGAVWTLGPKRLTLRNGDPTGGGLGTMYKYVDSVVYVLGVDNPPNWYSWTNSGWNKVGPTEPGVIAPPQPTDPFIGLNWPASVGERLALLGKMKGQGYRFVMLDKRPDEKPATETVYFEKVGREL